MESEAAVNEDFNLSTAQSTTVLELAQLIWRKVHGESKPFNCVKRRAVSLRRPEARCRRYPRPGSCSISRRTTTIEAMLDEVFRGLAQQIHAGGI